MNLIVAIDGINCIAKLVDYRLIESVHCFRTIDSYGCNSVAYFGVNIGKIPFLVPAGLLSKKFRNLPVTFTGFILTQLQVILRHFKRFQNANSIHQFKRTTCPSQTNLSPAVDIFYGANSLINNLGCNAEHDAIQTARNLLKLLLRI